ncbi:CHAD domain-containing protein [Dyella solisilvae]|nr:CHAD domain-containing protein [Dyella solisilvae]
MTKAHDARKRLLEEPYDAKLLHAWRVSLRRVTATLKDVARFSDDDLDDVLRYLRQCREATGSCRDIDILSDATLPAFIGKEGARLGDPEQMRQTVSDRQQEAHRQAVIALKKHDLAVPLQAWRHWVLSLDPPSDSAVRQVAAAAIEERFGTLKKRAAKLDGGQKRLHRLRTATKKLRYTIELYQHVFPRQSSAAWLKQLADLQGHLGQAHDYMMGSALLPSLAGSGEEGPQLKPFRRWAKRMAFDASKKSVHSLTRLEELRPYWRPHAH